MSDDAASAGPLVRGLDLVREIAELARKHDRFLWGEPETGDEDGPAELTERDLAEVRAALEGFQESLRMAWESDRRPLRAWRRGSGGPPERLVPLEHAGSAWPPPCRADEAVQLLLDFDAKLRALVPAVDDDEPFDVDDFLEGWDTDAEAVAKAAPDPEDLARLKAEVLEEFRAAPEGPPAGPASPPAPGVDPEAAGAAVLGLLEAIAGLLELARGAGLAAEPSSVLLAKGRLRAAFPAAIDAPVMAARLLHRNRGGVRMKWYKGMATSCSDAVLDVGADLMDRLFDATAAEGEDGPGGWRQDLSEWKETVEWMGEQLDEVPPGFGDLADRVRDEHGRSGSIELPLAYTYVFEDQDEPVVVNRRAESIALLDQFRIPTEAAPGAKLMAGESAVEQIFYVPGEAPHRFLTKIGGLPYRLAHEAWPAGRDGRPLTFVAQFCVPAAYDLFPDGLYEEVLLIFARSESDLLSVNPYQDGLHFEWWPLGASPAKLVQAGDVPKTGWRIKPYFGVHLRTGDLHLVGPSPHVKIGGWPDFLQGGPRRGYYGGEFLLQLGRPGPVPPGLDRWAHQADPAAKGREITIGDDGYLYLFMRADQTIDAYPECY
ncbi:hypothetical protein OJF2_06140 [Aquisphaera giovannonii]|uniref:DUF1963 domain-containing protein n=1 Tax=Aquisphaera giovannonii TaxID=406548 RepID=A0A5B9VWJ1_9BACT|nr:DUF1963 domain-containing protein [Aquisphaera giovannonii]QEH32145.1 hypothetical protein OJF2_06140 [Aquisphaera giovannonii]